MSDDVKAAVVLVEGVRAMAMHLRELRARAERTEAELARRTSDVPGLSPGPAYTAADVDAIERHRGKPYERLRATVADRDEAVTRAREEMREACERHYRKLLDAAAALRERAEKAEADRDEAVRALRGLAAKYDPRASRSGGASYIADADASAEWRVVVDLLAKHPEAP
jgi:hypothetical protein